MKKTLSNKMKVVLIAAAIFIVSAGVLFTTVSLAQGAETNKTITGQSTYTETVLSAEASPSASGAVTGQTTAGPSPSQCVTSAAPSGTPGAEYISEDEASSIFTKAALYLFGIKTDVSKPHLGTDSNGNTFWSITNKTCDCSIDAISGAVIEFDPHTKYNGKKIKEGEFNTPPYSNLLNDDPNNIYIIATKDFVNSKLAKGRAIDKIEVNSTQFVWDNNKSGFDPNAKGTILAECLVYMHTGPSYTLSFWGTENPELNKFYSYPTQDGCRYDYFYEQDAENFFASPSATWYQAPGLVGGAASQPTTTPTP